APDRAWIRRNNSRRGRFRRRRAAQEPAPGALPTAPLADRTSSGALPGTCFVDRISSGALPGTLFVERVRSGALPAPVVAGRISSGAPPGSCFVDRISSGVSSITRRVVGRRGLSLTSHALALHARRHPSDVFCHRVERCVGLERLITPLP